MPDDRLLDALRSLEAHEEDGLDPAEVWQAAHARERRVLAVAGVGTMVTVAALVLATLRFAPGPVIGVAGPSTSQSEAFQTALPELVGTSWKLVKIVEQSNSTAAASGVESSGASLSFPVEQPGVLHGFDGVNPFQCDITASQAAATGSKSNGEFVLQSCARGLAGYAGPSNSPEARAKGAVGKVLSDGGRVKFVLSGGQLELTHGNWSLVYTEGPRLSPQPLPSPTDMPSSGFPTVTISTTPAPAQSMDALAGTRWRLDDVVTNGEPADVSSIGARLEFSAKGVREVTGTDGMSTFDCRWDETTPVPEGATAVLVWQHCGVKEVGDPNTAPSPTKEAVAGVGALLRGSSTIVSLDGKWLTLISGNTTLAYSRA